MNWLIIVSHHVANSLSYYHAGWDYPETARQEREACRNAAFAWQQCAAALKEAGIYEEFKRAGRYLI